MESPENIRNCVLHFYIKMGALKTQNCKICKLNSIQGKLEKVKKIMCRYRTMKNTLKFTVLKSGQEKNEQRFLKKFIRVEYNTSSRDFHHSY
jgi:hypothetical protein